MPLILEGSLCWCSRPGHGVLTGGRWLCASHLTQAGFGVITVPRYQDVEISFPEKEQIMSKVNWKGMEDGTPPSNPHAPLIDAPEPKSPSGSDWKGHEDGTPSSRPTQPNKG
jgi:hypothetical protein